MLPLLQATILPSNANFGPSASPAGNFLSTSSFFWVIIGVIVLGLFIATLFLLRIIIRAKDRRTQAFDRVLMRILVPKQRKSESQSEDRLEQIREEIGISETIFATIAALKPKRSFFHGRKDHISFEIISHENLIYFYVAVPHKQQQFVEQQIHAQFPYAQIDQMADYNIFSEHSAIVSAYIKAKRPAPFPFKSYKTLDSDPLSPILNALSKVNEGNNAGAIQFVIRPAHRSWAQAGVKLVREVKKGKKFEKVLAENPMTGILNTVSDLFSGIFSSSQQQDLQKEQYQLSAMEEEMLKGIEEKISKGGLEVTMRIVSISDDQNTARLNLDNMVNSFGQYNLYQYGNSLAAQVPRKQSKVIRNFIYRTFDEKRKITVNTEEMASLWHPPLPSTEAPSVKWLGARTAPPPPNLPEEGLLLGHVQYRGKDLKVRMKPDDRRRHLYVIGKSGGGKSVYVSGLAVQDIKNGHGVCVVDPHGDLVEYILEHIPKERADDVILFNPSDTSRPIGLNMLEAKSEEQKDFAVQEMISIFYKLFPPEMIGPMFEHNMRNVMLTLMADVDNPGTIIDIPRMFTDDDYVAIYLKKLKDPMVRDFWEKEMAKQTEQTKSEMLGYLISKVGRFVENEMMRNIMGQQKSGFDFREVMDNQKILLVNLAKGTTGEVNAKLIGLIIVAKLQMAAMGRADMAEEDRKDFFLYIDEFQNFVTDSIATILSEARKYKLDLIIAHQYLGQLTDDKGGTGIRDAVLGNAGTISCFRIGPDDSEVLAKEFAPTFTAHDLINVEKFTAYIKLLIDNTAATPFNMRTYPPVAGNKELAAAIKELSRLKYGRDKRLVEERIMDRTKLGA